MKQMTGWQLIWRLLAELRQLTFVMIITICLGVLGFLAAIFISSFAIIGLGVMLGEVTTLSLRAVIGVMATLAIIRGFLRYGEQLAGHYLAFKILKQLRDRVFHHLRVLAPAKLETHAKGNLIAVVTSDIEMLEVFYAHTIAPIAIAIITNGIIVGLLAFVHPLFGMIGASAYLLVGLVLPWYSSRIANRAGRAYRETFSEGNTFLLDSLHGLNELVAFGGEQQRLAELDRHSQRLNAQMAVLKKDEATVIGWSEVIISVALISSLVAGFSLYAQGVVSLSAVLFASVLLVSSFGPVVALSRLANTLGHTFACARRLFTLLDEQPNVQEVSGEQPLTLTTVGMEQVHFEYATQPVLRDVTFNLKAGTQIAIVGPSGSGKSTLLKLLMRYFDPQQGTISLNNQSLTELPTQTLRMSESVMSQETFLFKRSIRENLLLARPTATMAEIEAAAKKAAIHDFICALPAGYDSEVGELGSLLSSGERQRLGLARLFLHEGQLLLLDEPTSNLDALNEAAILTALQKYSANKTLIFSSHRHSTLAIAQRVYTMADGKLIAVEG